MKYKYKIIPIGIMITGLLFSDDPLFVYFGLLPILIAYFVLYFFGKFSIKELERFIIFALAACLISFMIKMLLKIVLPIQYFSHTTSIANIDVVLQTIKGFFDGGMGIFGIKLFGYTKLSIVFLQSLLFLGVYLIIATFFYINKNNKNEKLFVTVISFLFLIPFLIFFIGTKTAGGVASSRYLIMLVYIIPLISIWAIYNIKLKRQLVIYGLLVGMIVISSSYNIYLSTKDTNKANNALSYEIINLANTNGLNKGVARLWHSNITTYLSSFSQNVFTAGCRDEELVINNILFETAVLNKDANNSYYIYDSLSPELDKCSPTQLVRQLGEPIKTIELKSNPGVYMVIYNKDITKNIKLMTFGSNNE